MAWVKFEVKTPDPWTDVLTHIHYEQINDEYVGDDFTLDAFCMDWAWELEDVQLAKEQCRPVHRSTEIVERPPREFCEDQIRKLQARITRAQRDIVFYQGAME